MTRVCGIREVGDVIEVGNRVEGGSWDAGPEIRLLFRIKIPREAELGNDLIESLARVRVCMCRRKPSPVGFR